MFRLLYDDAFIYSDYFDCVFFAMLPSRLVGSGEDDFGGLSYDVEGSGCYLEISLG